MDKNIIELMEDNIRPFNRKVMDGLAIVYLEKSLEYIDRVMTTAIKHDELIYHGCDVCTPAEEYLEVTKLRNNKRTYDLAKSDLFLAKFVFSFQGEMLPTKYIYIPYVRDAGILFLKGSKMHITPVLNDKVISPGISTLFVRLLRYKIIFKRCYHAIKVDGTKEVLNVIWSDIYRKTTDRKTPITTKANSCIVHYLLGKYGLTKTFKLFLNVDVCSGIGQVNRKRFTKDKWVICESTGLKPKTHIESLYEPSKLWLAIPREQWNDDVKVTVTGFYYVVDHFPERVTLDMLDDPDIWKILLGHILFSGNYGENKLYSDVSEHFKSIDEYVDEIVIEKLKDGGYDIKDFYELLNFINIKFNDFITNTSVSALSMYGKSLEVLYYTLYEITSDIFNVSYKLSKPKMRGPLTINNIKEIFNKNMRMRAIRSLGPSKPGIETVNYSGDHKYFKLTSKISEQETVPGSNDGGKKRVSLGQDKHLDVSALEAGSVLFLAKSDPTPTNKINPFVNIDLKTGDILPNKDFEHIKNKVACKIKGVNKYRR